MFLCAAITLQQDTILLLGFAPSLYSPYECNPLLAFVDILGLEYLTLANTLRFARSLTGLEAVTP